MPCVALRLLCVLRLGRVITVVRSVASSGRSLLFAVIQFIDLELHLSSQAKLNSPPPNSVPAESSVQLADGPTSSSEFLVRRGARRALRGQRTTLRRASVRAVQALAPSRPVVAANHEMTAASVATIQQHQNSSGACTSNINFDASERRWSPGSRLRIAWLSSHAVPHHE